MPTIQVKDGNGSLQTINTPPDLGQATAPNSVPVVLPAAQITTLTPPAAITGYATEATLGTINTEIGVLTETAPATDTASSGLNGRLQRVAQLITLLLARLPAALSNGFLQVSVKETITLPVSGTFFQATQPVSSADGSDATEGAKADAANTATDTTAVSGISIWKQISKSVQAIAASIAGTLTVATHAVTQSGTWTVQPGNTANTTAWKVDGSAVTQPVSGTVTANAGANLNTSALALEAGNLASIKNDVDKIPSQGQALAAASMPVVLTAAQITTLTPPAAITGFALDTTVATTNTGVGGLTETAPATDIASSGLNGRLQRIAQRLTSMIALLPAALGAGGGLKVDGSGTALPISAASLPTHGVTIADGSDSTEGAIADAVVAAGAAGSLSAKLRRVTQGLEDLKTLIVLGAGSALIGKVGIDQTTPGTTDSVSVATAQGAGATLGTTSGAAVITDVNGTIQQYLRGIVKLLITSGTIVLGAGANVIGHVVLDSGTVTANVVYPTYGTPLCGELQGNTGATQLPNIACKWVVFKAEFDNAGSVYLGISGVTKADGTTDTTTGLQLRPGDSSPVMEITNLNLLYRICDNAGDDLTYLGVSS